MQVLRSVLAAVKAGMSPNLDINPAAQAYLQAELALNQARGEVGQVEGRWWAAGGEGKTSLADQPLAGSERGR